MNNTSFSDNRFSDQSVKTSRNSARKLKNTANLHRILQLHQKPPLLPRKTKRAKEHKLHRTKTQTNGGKREITEQNLDEQRTAVAPAHNHTENCENLRELTLWMRTGFTRPHGGRLMILPVDQNVGTCLVKLGSTCAPFQPPSFITIHLKNLQKNRAAPLRPIALQRPSE